MVKEQYSQSDFQTSKYQYKIYNYGVVVEEGRTNKKSDLYPIFKKYGADGPIRVWVNGRKLTYSEIYEKIVPARIKMQLRKIQVYPRRTKLWKLQ